MSAYLKPLIDLIFCIAIFVLSLYILLIMHSSVHWELPYVPTMRQARKTLKGYLRVKPSDKIIDMGSGLGKMLAFFSRYPVSVTGIEQRKSLSILSKVRLFFHWFKKATVTVKHGSFFDENLSRYSLIYCFHIPCLIRKLVPKVEAEMSETAVLISYKFPFPLSDRFVEEKVQDAPDSYFYVYRRRSGIGV